MHLWNTIKETDLGHEVIKLIFDLQTTDTPELGNLAFEYLRQRNTEDPYFNDKIRLIGLREMKTFQGAISNYELLTHMKKVTSYSILEDGALVRSWIFLF